MRTVVEVTGVTARLLTDSNRPACGIMINYSIAWLKYTIIPCISSSAGSLSSLVSGLSMIASHVMFVALLIEEVDTVSVDIRMLCASFTYAVSACNSVLFALQTE